jgi:hypothetical protein
MLLLLSDVAAAAGWEPLSHAVSVQGAVNAVEGSQGWSVELALPWSLLKQAAGRAAPPKPGGSASNTVTS